MGVGKEVANIMWCPLIFYITTIESKYSPTRYEIPQGFPKVV
jgi:hypothetical protein